MKSYLILLLLLSPALTFANDRPKKLKEGRWRTEVYLNKSDTLPFSFYYYNELKRLVIINASESINLENVIINGENISVKFPIFNSELIGKIKSKKLIEGFWHNYSKGPDYKIPFKANFGKEQRFLVKQSNASNFIGKWEVTFDYNSKNPEKAIGLFEEHFGTMRGTFLTETGDYRFLGGTSSHNELKLSCFDGSHAFLFKSVLKNDTLWGSFNSGSHYKTNWFAVKNDQFELRDPEKLTYVAHQEEILNFSFKSSDNTTYTYPNKSVKNKVVLIQILGTWCPNCMDETNYLTSIYKKHKNNLEIIGVGFEPGETEEEKLNNIKRYKTYMNVEYPVLLGGDACKPCAVKAFPMLNSIISFPTLLIIDKKGEIRKIHTGFSGPSTGHYYTDFIESTNAFIEELINE